MAKGLRRRRALRGHTGRTAKGNTRDVKIKRIGKVTVYKRGYAYYLYYRENGKTVRRPIEGNLSTAEATAHTTSAALVERRPTPLGYRRTSPEDMVEMYLDSVAHVQNLALRTQDRYRAALDRFKEFASGTCISHIDTVDENTVEEFVRWLRRQKRPRNGMRKSKAKVDRYKIGGIKFILSTCRTAFNWASRRRMLPAFSANPFARFGVEKLKDDGDQTDGATIFTPEQERAFFAACNEWQKPIFTILAAYGMRVGELNHLLIEDLDFEQAVIHIRSKTEMLWRVKTRRRRDLPLTDKTAAILRRLVGRRKAGFVFQNEEFASGYRKAATSFSSDMAFRAHVRQLTEDVMAANPEATERDCLKVVTRFCRSMGQVPVRRLQAEFCKVTKAIGCPELTRVHDLRHLFATRAQELGLNPFIVQQITGHEGLSMLGRYTHLGNDVKRDAVRQVVAGLASVAGGTSIEQAGDVRPDAV